MGLFPGWPIDHGFLGMGAICSLVSLPAALSAVAGLPSIVMLVLALTYAILYLVPGFIKGATTVLGYAGKPAAPQPYFDWKLYYCLCASESATMVACAAMFYDAGWMGPIAAVTFCILGNFAGYAKYYVQMWYDHEYVATSIFLYLLSFMTLAILQRDPMYYIFMVYPFMILLKVPDYGNMRGRKILFDEPSIILHSCDHIIHGTITCSVAIYHYFGLLPTLLAHLFIVPLGYFISDGTTRIQQTLATEKVK